MKHLPSFKLSICIATFNRSAFIGETLQSVIDQATNECEIVVSDNASTDDTEQVVMSYASRFDRLRYVRQPTNKGLDRNFDRAVELARGEYCWLMSDDDLLKPAAVKTVLNALGRDLSLVVLNVEQRDFSLARVLRHRWLEFESDRLYGRAEMDRLFSELDETLWYISNIVVKREIWLDRDRERYYGSLFIHVGVIFQKYLPGETLVIATPLVIFRLGNAHSFELSDMFFVKWPALVESLAVSATARSKVRSAEPWKNPLWLLLLRACGVYSMNEYRQWISPRLTSIREKSAPVLIALLPGVVLNLFFVLYCLIRRNHGDWLIGLTQSRFNPRSWLAVKHKPVASAGRGTNAM